MTAEQVTHRWKNHEATYRASDLRLLSARIEGPGGAVSATRRASEFGWDLALDRARHADGVSATEREVISLPDHLVFAVLRERVGL